MATPGYYISLCYGCATKGNPRPQHGWRHINATKSFGYCISCGGNLNNKKPSLEEILGIPEKPTVHTNHERPLRANLGRGKSTCYVSSALQILHNVHPFATILKNIKLVTDQNADILAKDANLNKHKTFLKCLQTTMSLLDLYANTENKIPSVHTQAFRMACDGLATLMGSSGPWKDEDSDSVEFLGFILETLNKISDTSGVQDPLAKTTPLALLENSRDWDRAAGASLPGLDQDTDGHWVSRKNSGYNSDIDETHTVQRIVESQCEKPDCRRVVRKFEFAWHITLSAANVEANEDGFLDFADLREASFSDRLTTQSGGTSCPYCADKPPSQRGRLVEVRSRIANEPELFMVEIGRHTQIGETDVRRITNYDHFDMKDWTPRIFSDPADYQPRSLRYNLVGALFYLHSPPHYIPFIRLGKEENALSLPNLPPSRRYGRLNDGKWVMFDDTKYQPTYRSPYLEMATPLCESLLIFRKAVPTNESLTAGSKVGEEQKPPESESESTSAVPPTPSSDSLLFFASPDHSQTIDDINLEAVDQKKERLKAREQRVQGRERSVNEQEQGLDVQKECLAERERKVREHEEYLNDRDQEMEVQKESLRARERKVRERERPLSEREQEMSERADSLDEREKKLREKEDFVNELAHQLREREHELRCREFEISDLTNDLPPSYRLRSLLNELNLADLCEALSILSDTMRTRMQGRQSSHLHGYRPPFLSGAQEDTSRIPAADPEYAPTSSPRTPARLGVRASRIPIRINHRRLQLHRTTVPAGTETVVQGGQTLSTDRRPATSLGVPPGSQVSDEKTPSFPQDSAQRKPASALEGEWCPESGSQRGKKQPEPPLKYQQSTEMATHLRLRYNEITRVERRTEGPDDELQLYVYRQGVPPRWESRRKLMKERPDLADLFH
ncbi:uncharacterized protein Z520_05843 [Fonsecaea multimorphosa CBS 102226]|uniref:USP domain-containing protein n=1 Tax=Fonsecaea multimorphosa CBS 102226 TaxID=1442371 RepID=A0A0D2JYC7_9EURO|nr:uncharacterized protein Z520_05843 [Fonsecaea multimorphosa CBS 102226]KIX98542.1 hypothetical protein Z520_05843 [Fonsecaea multimorphosa CBS 102226]OAL24734.1 hypothetical protein AYO22_05523 [Fonsecaea multimorphosa]